MPLSKITQLIISLIKLCGVKYAVALVFFCCKSPHQQGLVKLKARIVKAIRKNNQTLFADDTYHNCKYRKFIYTIIVE